MSEVFNDPVRRGPAWPLAAAFLIPLAFVGLRYFVPPAADRSWSLIDLPRAMHRHMHYVFLIPLGGLIVAFFRLTLGLRVLSFFRPILLAIAFRAAGISLSLAFLTLVLAGVIVLWPLLRGAHYYARVSVLLSVAAAAVAFPVIAAGWYHTDWLARLAYFPLISLCLICDTFAKVLDDKGIGEAVWRAVTTVAAGLAITAVAVVPHLIDLWLRYPELLLAQIGLAGIIERYLSFEWLDGYRPFGANQRTTAAQKALEEICA
jgi:uncharacterized protein with transglutaminase domain